MWEMKFSYSWEIEITEENISLSESKILNKIVSNTSLSINLRNFFCLCIFVFCLELTDTILRFHMQKSGVFKQAPGEMAKKHQKIKQNNKENKLTECFVSKEHLYFEFKTTEN